jgi:uncharacterized protein
VIASSYSEWGPSSLRMMLHLRWLELVVLYAVMPVALAWAVNRYAYRGAMAPLLWIASGVATAVLLADPSFDRSVLFRISLDEPYLEVVALRFCVLAPPLLALGRWLAPEDFLQLPRRRPGLWLALAALYPVFSALPQGILFRVFFLQRYGALFESSALLLVVGALAFSFGHVIFRNIPALVITAAGGALFLQTYRQTQSMLLATAEHGAYGILAFTAGLGRFLYLGGRSRGVSAAASATEAGAPERAQ